MSSALGQQFPQQYPYQQVPQQYPFQRRQNPYDEFQQNLDAWQSNNQFLDQRGGDRFGGGFL